MRTRPLRDFIIGKTIIPSLKLYKQAMLRGQMAIMMFFTGVGYIGIDIAYDIYRNIPMYSLIAVVGLLTFLLNRTGYYRLATVIIILSANILIYLFAASENPTSGVYIFFLPIALASIVLFSYKEWYWAFGFVLFGFALFLLAFLVGFSILPKMSGPDETDEIYFLVNYIIATTVSVLIVYFLININYHVEKSLRDNEARLIQLTEELKQSNTELDRFVYSVSHDLRAPLSSLLGLVSLAEKATDPQEVSSLLAMMRNRIDAQEKFIRDIIDYSRNARLKNEHEEINLNEIINEIMDNLRYAEEVSSVKIKTDIPEQYALKTDKVRLKIVLNNLLSNALKYHDRHKPERFVKICVQNESSHCEILVEDNGVGINSDHHEKIFDMFYRASENSKGSGLGLYIAREAVKKLGGEITVESRLGKGTRFKITLPNN
ncbi:MAG: HAMP domain-containing histidine kinase [Cyclobacteriaceae bacterium]|nr:HAMP domain-containing histidine kinase [Cyclobacteriaceae bacterium]